MANGGFAGGLAQGLQSGLGVMGQFAQIKNQRAQMDTERDKAERDRAAADAKFIEGVEPKLLDALREPDADIRNVALDALFGAVEEHTGKKVSPIAMKLFKSNPETANEIVSAAKESGMTLGDLFKLTGDPQATAAGLLAFSRRRREQRAAAATAGTGQFAGETPEPTSAVPAPTAPLQAAAEFIRQDIGNIRQRLQQMADGGASDRSISAVQSQLEARQKQLDALTVTPALAQVERGRTPATVEELRIAGQPVGTPRGALPGARQGAPAGAPAVAVSGTAPLAAAPGGGAPGIPETEQNKDIRELRIKPIKDTFGEDIAREAAQAGLRNTGETLDAIASGRFRPLAPEERERLDKAAGAGESLALEKQKKWSTARDNAVEMRGALSLMASSLAQAGPTGKIVGPVREALMQVGAAFGAKPEALAALETTESLSIFLASQTLKDFTGNDSDREFMAAMQRNPGLRKQPDTNARLIRIALHNANMQQQRADFADKWRGEFGTLTSKHPTSKRSFDEAWNAYRNAISPVVSEEVLERLRKGTR